MEREQRGARPERCPATAPSPCAHARTRPQQLSRPAAGRERPAAERERGPASAPTSLAATATAPTDLCVRAAAGTAVPTVPVVLSLPVLDASARTAAATHAASDAVGPAEAHVFDRGRDAGAGHVGAAAQARAALLQVRLERVQGQGRARVLQQPVPGLREARVQGAQQQAAGPDVRRCVAVSAGMRTRGRCLLNPDVGQRVSWSREGAMRSSTLQSSRTFGEGQP